MALDPVGAADDEDRVVENLQGAFGLGGEIDMSRGVKQGEAHVAVIEDRLFGKNRNAPVAFQGVVIEKGVAVIDPAELTEVTGAVHQRLGQGRFTGVDMRKNADSDFFHTITSCFHSDSIIPYFIKK